MNELNSNFEIQNCDDGSKTIYLPEIDEYYHSKSGAVSQSKYVYVQNGLNFIAQNKSQINLLEIGFGTGLNAISTLDYLSKNSDVSVNYFTLEPFPLDQNILKSLEQENLFDDDLHKFISKMYDCQSDKWVAITDNFKLFKAKIKLENLILNKVFSPDLVYFDAFAPSKQAEMWTLDNLQKATINMKSESVLVTYSAQGQFRRNLKKLGFRIEKLAGANQKREMTRAVKL